MTRLFSLSLSLLLVSLFVQAAGAASIALNFAATDPDAATSSVAGPAGVLATANWNNLAGNIGGPVGSLIDDAGAATAASVSWTSENTWRSGARNLGSGGDAQLMSGYLDYLPANPPMITVSGLDAALGTPAYDVHVYVQGDSDQIRAGEYTVNGSTLALTDDSPFSATNDYVVGENYLLFTGITGDEISITSLAVDLGGGETLRAPINGVEIVGAIPEPGTIALVGLGLVGLVAVGRRRD
jgi:hypothetical protein